MVVATPLFSLFDPSFARGPWTQTSSTHSEVRDRIAISSRGIDTEQRDTVPVVLTTRRAARRRLRKSPFTQLFHLPCQKCPNVILIFKGSLLMKLERKVDAD